MQPERLEVVRVVRASRRERNLRQQPECVAKDGIMRGSRQRRFGCLGRGARNRADIGAALELFDNLLSLLRSRQIT